jgi:hypothetical protein
MIAARSPRRQFPCRIQIGLPGRRSTSPAVKTVQEFLLECRGDACIWHTVSFLIIPDAMTTRNDCIKSLKTSKDVMSAHVGSFHAWLRNFAPQQETKMPATMHAFQKQAVIPPIHFIMPCQHKTGYCALMSRFDVSETLTPVLDFPIICSYNNYKKIYRPPSVGEPACSEIARNNRRKLRWIRN